jgi:hypothetical protein
MQERNWLPGQKEMLNALRLTKLQVGHPVYNDTADQKKVAERHRKAKAARKARRLARKR